MAGKPTDMEAVTKLLRDPVIVRIITILDIASLSILELLAYGLTRQDVNRALSAGIVEIDKETLPKADVTSAEGVLASGDVYFQQFLSSKVRLTELGRYLLDCMKGCQTEQEVIEKAQAMFASGTFSMPEHPHRPD